MDALGSMAGVLAAVAAVVWDLVVMGLGEVFGALREVALNTRAAATAVGAAPAARTNYWGLAFIAVALKVSGALLAATGIVGAICMPWHLPASRPAASASPEVPAPPRFDERGYPITSP